MNQTNRNFHELSGKTALVTGGSRGIGKAISIQLAQCGVKILAVARNKEDLDSLFKELPGTGHCVYTCDLSNIQEIDSLEEKIKVWGIPDIVVANFYSRTEPKKLSEYDLKKNPLPKGSAEYLLRLIPLCIPIQREKGFGRWIAIGSLVAEFAGPGQAWYSMEKKTIESLFLTLALEEGRYGVTANVVVPGFVDTPGTKTNYSKEKYSDLESLNLLGRAARPEEIAYAVQFLASPNASYITGIKLPVTGGAHINWPLRNKTKDNLKG
ncbi:SDR family oxidoreductase [Leptospira sp. 201903071]|uniref:SDR family NAD(P)-dependent oxidoreductase n=1 Tax=Leptospira ainazelensis TaxID=2810034 RepID=UPI001965EFE0|nr:SDR family oxidoreductase [Leptospira ainazelensis]MBM9499647.1 SDR family oxidoreductase [Leptospira ainazelensis]